MSPENRSNEDAAQLIAAHDAHPPQGPWDECDGCHVEYVRSLLARIAAVEAQLAAMGTPTTEYRRQFKSSSAWHVSVNGPFAEPSNRLRDRVVDEYRIVGEWRAASPTPTGPETETK